MEREQGNPNTWLVTLDTVLPSASLNGTNTGNKPLAIMLDALLQWVSPLAIQQGNEDEIASVFAEAVKNQLLPQDAFFELRDFVVFAELQMSCKELPVEDVEACIRSLRTTAPTLNPSNPKDLQTLALEVQKFFADPSRKYKQNVMRLENEVAQRDAQLHQVEATLIARIDELQRHSSEQLEAERKLNDERAAEQRRQHDEALTALKKQRDDEVAALQREREQREKAEKARRMLISARIRLSIGLILLVTALILGLYLVVIYGDQSKSIIERITGAWAIPTAILAIGIFLLGLFLGRERIAALNLPGADWWKG